MKHGKDKGTLRCLVWLLRLVSFSELAAHADQLYPDARMTFSEPFQIPGQTLAAGTCLFRLTDSGADRTVVQIFNAEGAALHATVQAIPTVRPEPGAHPVVTFAERSNGEPDALLSWLYLGDAVGHRFVYSDREERELAEDTHIRRTGISGRKEQTQ